MTIPEGIATRLRAAALGFCRDVIVFGAGALTACAMVAFLRREQQ